MIQKKKILKKQEDEQQKQEEIKRKQYYTIDEAAEKYEKLHLQVNLQYEFSCFYGVLNSYNIIILLNI